MAAGQQPIALRHGSVVGGNLAGVAGLQRPDEAVEEPAPAGEAFLEQPVHLRREPYGGDMVGDLRLAARGRTVQAEYPSVRRAVRLGACPDVGLPARRRKPPCHSPATGPAKPPQIGIACSAQAAPRHQQRHGLQQVGLAAAVWSEQHTDPPARAPGQRGVVAEVGQCEADEAHGNKIHP